MVEVGKEINAITLKNKHSWAISNDDSMDIAKDLKLIDIKKKYSKRTSQFQDKIEWLYKD